MTSHHAKFQLDSLKRSRVTHYENVHDNDDDDDDNDDDDDDERLPIPNALDGRIFSSFRRKDLI